MAVLLCYARSQGHEEIAELLIAELLIANGAEVNAQADSGRTPLDYALHSFKTRELLRKHGGKTWEELKAEGK
tara:strand:+ start:2736 stop:2954 length:219 start_codon:yes stop_codon:yes gene_type:complete